MSSRQAMDLGGSRKRGMKFGESKGGIKVFNLTHEFAQENTKRPCNESSSSIKKVNTNNMRPKQSLVDGFKKSPVQIKKTRSSLSHKENGDQMSDGDNINLVQLSKVNSDGNMKSSLSLQLVKAKTATLCEDKEVVDESSKNLEVHIGGNFGVNQVTRTPSNVDGEKEDEEVDKELEVVIENKSLDIVEDKNIMSVKEENGLFCSNGREVSNKAPLAATNHAMTHPTTQTKTKPISDQFHGSPRTESKLQSFFDLIMWRDVSRSAFVFGIGAFVIISSSYTKDLNISLISVLSYFGLVYLAANFLFRSLISRGAIDMDNIKQDYVVGEEEAVWLMRLVLPYVNELLLNLRGLFSGDPATTMKLAVLLFILARCGGSMTIWKMAKLGFFGAFFAPRVCSSYSSHFAAYGTFWIRRFGDAWKSCSHKKAVGFGMFTLVWNMSSVIVRIWGMFILFVAFKYYQVYCISEEQSQEEVTITGFSTGDTQYSEGRGQDPRCTITLIEKENRNQVC